MAPRISVLLPAYNAAATIGHAIRSIQTQTFRDWELLVVDDGSSDGTANVVHDLARGDDRVRLIARPHHGIVRTLHAALAASTGALLARMDADDEAYPGRFAAQVALFDERPELGLASCLVDFGGDRMANAGYALHVDWMNSVVTAHEIALNRFVESPFAHPSVMFRRATMEAHGGYREGDFPEDYDLWLRWLDAGVKMAKVPQSLLRWNDPPARLSRTDARYDADKFFATKAGWIARELRRVAAGRPVWIWGAGRPTRKRAAHLNAHGVAFAGFIDVDVKKTGRTIGDRPVIAPSALPCPSDAIVLGYVSSRGARDLIRAALCQARYREGTDFLMCA